MSTELYVNSENLVTLTTLTNQSTSAAVTDATVTVTLYDYTDRKYCDPAAVTDNGDGTVDIPSSAHGFASGDYVLLVGDDDYEAEYLLGAGTTTNAIEVTATYAAKTFNGSEMLLKAVTNARAISMTHSSGGTYSGTIPDTVKLVLNHEYWAVVNAVSGTNNAQFMQRWKAVYKS